ncbi:TPA: hypothetical protein OOG93_003211 [Morganella morganii]|nr:hypothetical protein [Morganella morganii]
MKKLFLGPAFTFFSLSAIAGMPNKGKICDNEMVYHALQEQIKYHTPWYKAEGWDKGYAASTILPITTLVDDFDAKVSYCEGAVIFTNDHLPSRRLHFQYKVNWETHPQSGGIGMFSLSPVGNPQTVI